MGFTPWGTYLACEENFNGYFRKTGAADASSNAATASRAAGAGYLWHTTDTRFNADDEPNEANRFGWVVEIDPFDPDVDAGQAHRARPPQARGRLGAGGPRRPRRRLHGRRRAVRVHLPLRVEPAVAAGAPARASTRSTTARSTSPSSTPTATGEWLPLTPDNPALAGWSLNDILINTRGAADWPGATKMDRPEWIDTFPESLTAIAHADQQHPSRHRAGNAADRCRRTRATPNVYGHIIRWCYRNDFTEPTFGWDIFALGGDPAERRRTARRSSATSTARPTASTSRRAAGCGSRPTCRAARSTPAPTPASATTRCCAPIPTTRRDASLPRRPEASARSPACSSRRTRRTMFVGIQHPGEAPSGANDPANPKQLQLVAGRAAGGRPRSACIVITKDDGGPIGS